MTSCTQKTKAKKDGFGRCFPAAWKEPAAADSRGNWYLAIPLKVAREHGAAAQTLAAVANLADRQTGKVYAKRLATVAVEASQAAVSVGRNLRLIRDAGYLEDGRAWATAAIEYRLTAAGRDKGEYAPLPILLARQLQAAKRSWSYILLASVLLKEWDQTDRFAPRSSTPSKLAKKTGLHLKTVKMVLRKIAADPTLPDGLRGQAEASLGAEKSTRLLPIFRENTGGKTDAPSYPKLERSDISSKTACGGPADEISNPLEKPKESDTNRKPVARRWLRDVRPEDLRTTDRLKGLFDRAKRDGCLEPGMTAIKFAALACCARDGKRNPSGYFAKACWQGVDPPAEYYQQARATYGIGYAREPAPAPAGDAFAEMRRQLAARLTTPIGERL